jgi:hypothetical protein
MAGELVDSATVAGSADMDMPVGAAEHLAGARASMAADSGK